VESRYIGRKKLIPSKTRPNIKRAESPTGHVEVKGVGGGAATFELTSSGNGRYLAQRDHGLHGPGLNNSD